MYASMARLLFLLANLTLLVLSLSEHPQQHAAIIRNPVAPFPMAADEIRKL